MSCRETKNKKRYCRCDESSSVLLIVICCCRSGGIKIEFESFRNFPLVKMGRKKFSQFKWDGHSSKVNLTLNSSSTHVSHKTHFRTLLIMPRQESFHRFYTEVVSFRTYWKLSINQQKKSSRIGNNLDFLLPSFTRKNYYLTWTCFHTL